MNEIAEYTKFDWNREPERLTLRGGTAAMASEFFNRADMQGQGIYSSQKRMAERIGYSISTVRRAEAELLEKGLARRTVKGSDFGRSANSSQWVLTIPGIPSTFDGSLQEQCSFLTGTVSIGDKNSVHQWSTNIPVNIPDNISVSKEPLNEVPTVEDDNATDKSVADAAVLTAAALSSTDSIDQLSVSIDGHCSLGNGKRQEALEKLFAALPLKAEYIGPDITGLTNSEHQRFMSELVDDAVVVKDPDTRMVYKVGAA